MKYFEALTEDDGAIVIDDNFQNLEVLAKIPLANIVCTKTNIGVTHYAFYKLPTINYVNATPVIYGLSLNGLNDVKPFSFDLRNPVSGSGLAVYFYDTSCGSNATKYVESVERADIVAKASVYLFGYKQRSASEHLAGLEIYNADGDVTYSSAAPYAYILGCGSDDQETITFKDTTIACNLGTDAYTDIKESHKAGTKGIESVMRPGYVVSSNSVTINKLRINVVYVDDVEDDLVEREYFSAYYSYGWLILTFKS